MKPLLAALPLLFATVLLADAVPTSAKSDTSIVELKRLADGGDTQAQLDLSFKYHLGIGIDKNEGESLKYCKLSAEGGNPHGAHDLALRYQYGMGTSRDYDKAFNWYTIAAKKNDMTGQEALAMCYLRGQGTKQDTSEAIKWLTIVANRGLGSANLTLGELYAQGAPNLKINYVESYARASIAAALHDDYAVRMCKDLEAQLKSEFPKAKERAKDIWKEIKFEE